jgi:hypothetical protein
MTNRKGSVAGTFFLIVLGVAAVAAVWYYTVKFRSELSASSSSTTNAPFIHLYVNGYSEKTSVETGSQYTLTWTSLGVNNCTGSGLWSGPQNPSGSLSVNVPAALPMGSQFNSANSFYQLNCVAGDGTTLQDSILVNVYSGTSTGLFPTLQ